MRILVISDTHGDLRALTRIVEENQNADYILHLGDCEEECRALLADKPELASRFLRVRGNNDFGSSTPLFATLRVSLQHKIFFTHGHRRQKKITATSPSLDTPTVPCAPIPTVSM